jgi:DNA-binding XRE family transcriptional regulator
VDSAGEDCASCDPEADGVAGVLYERRGSTFVIAAIAPEAEVDPRGFDRGGPSGPSATGREQVMAELVPHERVHDRLMQDPEVAQARQETELARKVARFLVAYRAEHRLTQTALAQKLGMRQPAVARLEAGDHNPTFRTLVRLAGALGVEFTLHISKDGLALTA